MALLDSDWYRDGLRRWLDEVQRIGELLHVSNAHWDAEMGSITQMLTEKSNNSALKHSFPVVVDVSGDLRAKLRAKFPHIFPPM
jgi:hypothetical protein